MDLCHVGDVRQWDLTPGDQVVPSGRLHVPQIQLPRDTEPKNLHGDVEGSPYSRNPGEIGLEDIEAKAREERVRSQPAKPTERSRSEESERAAPSKK
jgi:hypothetical protein